MRTAPSCTPLGISDEWQIAQRAVRSDMVVVGPPLVGFMPGIGQAQKPVLIEAADRGVDVNILLESPEGQGGNLTVDSVSPMREVLPRARFYAWHNRLEKFAGGSVHAKVAVADDLLVFVTSANLTGYAMNRNIQAGMLLRGGGHPGKLAEYLEAMVTTAIIQEL